MVRRWWEYQKRKGREEEEVCGSGYNGLELNEEATDKRDTVHFCVFSGNPGRNGYKQMVLAA